jgi:hypothetical protein
MDLYYYYRIFPVVIPLKLAAYPEDHFEVTFLVLVPIVNTHFFPYMTIEPIKDYRRLTNMHLTAITISACF